MSMITVLCLLLIFFRACKMKLASRDILLLLMFFTVLLLVVFSVKELWNQIHCYTSTSLPFVWFDR
jgi:hypothetical protein